MVLILCTKITEIKEQLSRIFERNENILQRFISESAPYIKLSSFKSESQLRVYEVII